MTWHCRLKWQAHHYIAASTMIPNPELDMNELVGRIKGWGLALGFQQVGISDIELTEAEHHLQNWLDHGRHGEMHYMSAHGLKRSRPALLQPGTRSIISVRMDYQPEPPANSQQQLDNPAAAYVSRYALGRDYHKVLRNRLQTLADQICREVGDFGYRAFVDSAPVLEKAIAEKAGLGWIGKHSNLLNRKAGSWFFLGELFTDLPLPADQPSTAHCGQCRACLDICPTQAIVAPYQVDARLCVSYLTIELAGSIPQELRPLLGNRIYGCDDCQLICPWNRFAKSHKEERLEPHLTMLNMTQGDWQDLQDETFQNLFENSALHRTGILGIKRNLSLFKPIEKL